MRKILNIGEIPNDGKGDKLRHAFDLSQQNFVEIYKFFGDGQNITSLSVRQKLDTPTNAEVDTKIVNATTLSGTHMRNVSNPHNVTKEQIGLSNVDNTSDANKPVSITTQQALNLKANLDATKKVPISELPVASATQKGILQVINDLSTGGINNALSAEMGKSLLKMFVTQSAGDFRYFRIPNASNPDRPTIVIIGSVAGSITANVDVVCTFPYVFPNMTPLMLVCNGDGVAALNSIISVSQNITPSGFSWRSNNSGATRCNYIAIGN